MALVGSLQSEIGCSDDWQPDCTASELARIGDTSIEWILTGRHWENGSTEMERMKPELYELAAQLHLFSDEERRILAEALEMIHGAVAALRQSGTGELRDLTDAELARALRSFEKHGREALVAALSVYDAVVATLAGSKVRELRRFGMTGNAAPLEGAVRVSGLQKNAG